MVKPEKKHLAPERPPVSYNATSNITHFAIADHNSSRAATIFNAHCTALSALEDLNVEFCESRRKVSTIPCRAVGMTSCASVQCPGLNCEWGRSGLFAIIMASNKLECNLPIRSLLSVPVLGTLSYNIFY